MVRAGGLGHGSSFSTQKTEYANGSGLPSPKKKLASPRHAHEANGKPAGPALENRCMPRVVCDVHEDTGVLRAAGAVTVDGSSLSFRHVTAWTPSCHVLTCCSLSF
jgi:hypothetical protein